MRCVTWKTILRIEDNDYMMSYDIPANNHIIFLEHYETIWNNMEQSERLHERGECKPHEQLVHKHVGGSKPLKSRNP